MSYFVIQLTENGEIRVTKCTKEELEEKLNDKWWGESVTFHGEIPRIQYDTGLLIIRGEIVVPTAKVVVEKMEIP